MLLTEISFLKTPPTALNFLLWELHPSRESSCCCFDSPAHEPVLCLFCWSAWRRNNSRFISRISYSHIVQPRSWMCAERSLQMASSCYNNKSREPFSHLSLHTPIHPPSHPPIPCLQGHLLGITVTLRLHVSVIWDTTFPSWNDLIMFRAMNMI